VILCHNHPSGDPEPSPDDLQLTRRLVESGELLGVRVLDHVIFGDGRYVSLQDRGRM
jgi:DNA repair protein RadC